MRDNVRVCVCVCVCVCMCLPLRAPMRGVMCLLCQERAAARFTMTCWAPCACVHVHVHVCVTAASLSVTRVVGSSV